ncbi:MAG: hypothetical protein KatS3mg121_1051 [Gammaproteobacteria bacterium]|nr:MAG: hypothetical protein KatS3mg121_1051 [Gammaproteobacteria bacterium]
MSSGAAGAPPVRPGGPIHEGGRGPLRSVRPAPGVTLVELVVVLLLLGILGVVVLARLDVAPFARAAFVEEAKQAARSAQKFALLSGCQVQWRLDAAADRYDVFLRSDAAVPGCAAAAGPFTRPLNRPGGGVFGGQAPAGVDVTGPLAVVFDAAGRPDAGGSATIDGRTLTVEAETGYVHE